MGNPFNLNLHFRGSTISAGPVFPMPSSMLSAQKFNARPVLPPPRISTGPERVGPLEPLARTSYGLHVSVPITSRISGFAGTGVDTRGHPVAIGGFQFSLQRRGPK